MNELNRFSLQRRQLLAAVAATTATVATPQAWSQNAGRVLRVGHQKGWLSILKGRGTLEKRLAPLGVKVTWTEFNAGPVQLEALNVGSIDFGDVGEAPPIFAQAAGAPLVYAAVTIVLARRSRGQVRVFWNLNAAHGVMWAAGQAVWTYYDLFRGGVPVISFLLRKRREWFGDYALLGRYVRHPDPAQERYFFGLLRECVERGVVSEDLLREEMQRQHLRGDALDVLARTAPLPA